MAERLQQIIRGVGPERNPYANRVRADFASDALANVGGDREREMDLQLMLAHESLQGGDSATAAQSFRQLMELLARHRPQLPVLFMSGYTTRLSTIDGLLEPGVQLLEKPFTAHTLLTKTRQILGTTLMVHRS